MDPITSANPFAILLRQRLLERAKQAAKSAASKAATVSHTAPNSLAPLSSFVSNKCVTDHESNRALIEHMLGTEFGDHMLNQAKFQRLVDRVTKAMESDPELSRQMHKVLGALG